MARVTRHDFKVMLTLVDGLSIEACTEVYRAFYTDRPLPSRVPISSLCLAQSLVRESLTTDFVCMSVGIIAHRGNFVMSTLLSLVLY
jgi:hypothetical protein